MSRYIPLTHFWIFASLHKNHFKQRQCILWRYKCVSYLINIHSLKRCLQKLKIVNVLMFQLRLKFYFLQTNATRKEHVHELAVGCSWKETRKGPVWVWLYHVRLRVAGQEGAGSPEPSALLPCVLLSSLHPHLLIHQGRVLVGRDVPWCSSCHFPIPNHCDTNAVHQSITRFHKQWTELHSSTPRKSAYEQLFLASIRKKRNIFFLPSSCYWLQIIKIHKRKIAANFNMSKLHEIWSSKKYAYATRAVLCPPCKVTEVKPFNEAN